MNRTSGRESIRRSPFIWPIWVRVTLGMVLAAMVPTVLAFVIVERQVNTVDLENLRSYVSDRGQARLESITGALDHAGLEIASFAESQITYQALMNVLLSEEPNAEDGGNLTNFMDGQLVGSGLFSQVQLLNMDGEVVLSSSIPGQPGHTPSVPIGTDQGNSAAFRTGRIMTRIGNEQRLQVSYNQGALDIEIVHALYSEGEAAGILIGTVDAERTIIPALVGSASFVEVQSYLARSRGEVVAPEAWREQALASSLSSPLELAYALQQNTEIYRVADHDYVGHFTLVPDLNLVLITETPADVTFVQALSEVFEQGVLVLLAILLLASVIATVISFSITAPLGSLRNSINALIDGDFTSPVSAARRFDEIGVLARTFAQARDQLYNLMTVLEERIAARVRDIHATQEVSRFAATQRDLQGLMDNVVDLIIDSFPNIYHAQIFLLDQNEQYAVLRASTGKAGRQLLDRGHRLEVGSVSVIGQVTEEGRTVIARDTVASEMHQKNEFLPDTRAELAIPLRIGDRLIGALDVQSKVSHSFDEDQISVLQTMADQIAITIENARLYQESMRQLESLRSARREATGRAWREYLYAQRQSEFTSQAGAPAQTDLSPLRQRAIMQEAAVVGQETARNTVPFAVPIQLRGRTLGAVEWELPTADFSLDKLQLAQELVNRLAISLDNARLFQESLRAINRERIVNEIAARLTGQTDVDEILQIAVREVGQALGAPQVNINLKLSEDGQGLKG